MKSVAIIDYGMGNLHSVAKAVQHANDRVNVVVTSDASQLRKADRIIFPGVGALNGCITALVERDLVDVIRECVVNKPFLGICLGMHALLDFSEENEGIDGLGIIPGRVKHFANNPATSANERIKIPHMGWNQVQQTTTHVLWRGIPQDSRFYFVHSYFVAPELEYVRSETYHGAMFASAIGKDNIFATQFHPEKSQRLGIQLLANFLKWDG